MCLKLQNTMPASRRRMMAINTNSILIKKSAINDNRPDLANDFYFIRDAAVWSYKTYGWGVADYDGYIDHLSTIVNKRLYNVNVKLWYEIINKVFVRDKYTCTYCGQIGGKLECDHVTPISKGGSNNFDNLTTACRKCNRQKKDKTVKDFLSWRASKQ